MCVCVCMYVCIINIPRPALLLDPLARPSLSTLPLFRPSLSRLSLSLVPLSLLSLRLFLSRPSVSFSLSSHSL